MRRTFEVNVFGPMAMVQGFAPLLVKTATPERPTVIVNIGSTASLPPPFMATYGASKAAIQGLSGALRLEMYSLNVRVMTLELGVVRTAMSAGEKLGDIMRSPTSGYYDNFDEIFKQVEATMADLLTSAPTAAAVASQIADAVKASPPPKLWLGEMSAAFRFIVPLLPVRLLDHLWWKPQGVDKVKAPIR
ncbi:uncharacterized protein EHS24_003134 [Apiotrichum porosum]|uniref:Uncharacterized protein n=1 Tax=Apiotrichum porosum TaxID=105984 RepID=A0A427XFT0_9TREE|nr:uncharacterized protein EHS24_003134 [Apiotrichum porosum]RSH77574.1 hypothetical protein EHS24_003134 [Apiotrichum porosum]